MEQMDWVTTPQKALGPVTRIQRAQHGDCHRLQKLIGHALRRKVDEQRGIRVGQAVPYALGHLYALGGKALEHHRRAGPAQQGEHDQQNQRVCPPKPGAGFIGFLNRHGTIRFVLLCHRSHPPQLSFLRRYSLVFSMMSTTTNRVSSSVPSP